MRRYLYFVNLVMVLGLCEVALGQEPPVSPAETEVLSQETVAALEEPSKDVEEVSYEFSLDIKSAYLDVNGFMNSSDPVMQLDFTVAYPNGWYWDLWTSVGLGFQYNEGFDDEFDPIVGWSTDLEPDLTFDANLSYIDLVPLDSFKDKEEDAFQFEFSLTQSYEISDTVCVSPYVKTQTLVSPSGDSIPWETYIYGGVEHEWILDDRWSLEQNAYIIHDPGIYGLDDGLVAVYQGSFSYAVSERFTWRPFMLEAATPLTVNDERETDYVVGTGFTIAF